MSNTLALLLLAVTMAVVSVTFDTALTKSEQKASLALALQNETL